MQEFADERGVEAVSNSADGSNNAQPTSIARPRMIVVGDAEYDFGVMERDETRQHTFQLKNVGDAAANLKKGDTTCKCTLSELANNEVAPGEMVDVTLEWKPNSFADSFRQSANIEVLNDPANPLIKLEVHGRVIQSVRPVPEMIVLNNMSASESRQATVHVYYYREGDFNLQFDRYKDPSLADHLEVNVEPLPPELVDEEPEARSGVRITLTALPGLPLGPLNQMIYFKSAIADLPEIEIPIFGSVTGDISVLASKSLYNNDLRLLTLGGVSRAEGGVFHMQLVVKGPLAKETKLSVGETDPAEVLQVEIDTENPSSVNDGKVLLYPMTVTIPPDSRPVSRLGGKEGTGSPYGKIVINTTHPQAEKVVLLVKFAVQG